MRTTRARAAGVLLLPVLVLGTALAPPAAASSPEGTATDVVASDAGATTAAEPALVDPGAGGAVLTEPPEKAPWQLPPPPTVAPPPPAPAAAGPAVPTGSGTGRRVVYSGGAQRVWLVAADGRVERTYRVSGKRGTPRPGTYAVFSRSPKAFSTDGVTMRWMVRFTRGKRLAIGFHDIPLNRRGAPLQTEAQLGTYRSAGCVRQAPVDARALYDWAPVGTKVVVVG